MSSLHITQHAVERLAQRSIAASDINLIMEIGSEVDDGYLVRSQDRQAVEKILKRFLNRIRRLEGKRLVVSGGYIVTGYHANAREERKLLRSAPERDIKKCA